MKKLKGDEVTNKEYLNFTHGTAYSLLNYYSIFIFQIIISVLLARLLSQELWGFLILATSIIAIVLIVLRMFPPSLDLTVIYYIPKYKIQEQNSELRSFIKNSVILKLLFTIPVFIICIFLFYFLSFFFEISLNSYTDLLLILSPLIIITGLELVLNSIYRGFNRFKTIFELTLIKYIFYISSLIFLILFKESSTVQEIALINLITSGLPFLINCIIFSRLYKGLGPKKEFETPLKRTLSETTKRGTPLGTAIVINEFWKEVEFQSIGLYESGYVTGFNLSKYFSQISLNIMASISAPLFTSLANLNAKQNYEQINKIFNYTFKYSLFFLLLISGVLFFTAEFFLDFLYGETFLIYTDVVKLYLISIIFVVLGNILVPLLNVKNKVNIIPFLTLSYTIIIAPCFLIGLIYFGIIGGMYGLIISKLIVFILQIIVCFKIGGVRINFSKTFIQYGIFFCSLITSIILETLFFKNFRILFLNNLNLLVFNKLQFLSSCCFLLIYIILTLFFKIFSYKEIEYLENLFSEGTKFHLIIAKFLGSIKKGSKRFRN